LSQHHLSGYARTHLLRVTSICLSHVYSTPHLTHSLTVCGNVVVVVVVDYIIVLLCKCLWQIMVTLRE